MKVVNRRGFLLAAVWVFPVAAFTDSGTSSVRGVLRARDGKAGIETANGRFITLLGDEDTLAVLHDKRLEGSDLELIGRETAPGVFTVGPIHTKSMFVLKDGKRLFVTYWCPVCSIRAYRPGKCYCCQDETEVDLRDTLDQ